MEFKFKQDHKGQVTRINPGRTPVFIVSDDTVSADSENGTRPIAGYVEAIEDDGSVRVRIDPFDATVARIVAKTKAKAKPALSTSERITYEIIRNAKEASGEIQFVQVYEEGHFNFLIVINPITYPALDKVLTMLNYVIPPACRWRLQQVSLQHGKYTAINPPAPKYTGECPCGIASAGCEYHRGV